MRLEGIRPGGKIEGHLTQQPFAELLVGALRANLDGWLDFAFGTSDHQNRIVFRGGVPVFVTLPDVGPSLIHMLIEEGVLSSTHGTALVELTRSGQTESKVVESESILTNAQLREARARRAKAQLVRLIGLRDGNFQFIQGFADIDPSAVTLLEPLPLLYQGFLSSHLLSSMGSFLPPSNAQISFGATYPLGLDPFGLGAELESAIADGITLEGLVERGFSRTHAEAAIASLSLAEMLIIVAIYEQQQQTTSTPSAPVPSQSVPSQFGPSQRGVLNDKHTPPSEERGGLVLHTLKGRRPPTAEEAFDASAGVGGSREPLKYLRTIERFEDKNYFEILRVGPETEPGQLDRAYRYLIRRASEGASQGVGVIELLEEAYHVLSDPKSRSEYTIASLSERREIEANGRVESAFHAIELRKWDEALMFSTWACQLVPKHTMGTALKVSLEWLSASPAQRGAAPIAMVEELWGMTGDRRLQNLAHILLGRGDV